jgi:uncharacterized protein
VTETQILVFAKMPRPGHVKTRLVPPLTIEEAALVYAASLKDVIAGAMKTGMPLRILYDAEPGADRFFREEFPDLEREPQSVGSLGRRLTDAFAKAFAAGASVVVAIGTDSPTLPSTRLREALAATLETGAAVGPAADGGYYLIGLRQDIWPAAMNLFVEIPWSTDQVFATTMERAAEIGIAPLVLPGWYDIDRIDDLELARRDARPGSYLSRLLESWGHTPEASSLSGRGTQGRRMTSLE